MANLASQTSRAAEVACALPSQVGSCSTSWLGDKSRSCSDLDGRAPGFSRSGSKPEAPDAAWKTTVRITMCWTTTSAAARIPRRDLGTHPTLHCTIRTQESGTRSGIRSWRRAATRKRALGRWESTEFESAVSEASALGILLR